MNSLCVFIIVYTALLTVGQYASNVIANDNVPTADHEITDDMLRKFVELFVSMLEHSQPLPNENMSINSTKLFLNLSITNGTIEDPTTIIINSTKVNMPTLEFDIWVRYDSLKVIGYYDILIDNEYAHLESSDKYRIDITDLPARLYLKLNLTEEKTLQMENFILDYYPTIKVDFNNLGGNSEISATLNNVINSVLPDEIIETKPMVQESIKEIVFQRGEFIFKGMTVDQFVDLMNSLINSASLNGLWQLMKENQKLLLFT